MLQFEERQEHEAALSAAANILKEEYKRNHFFRDAVIASIKSALREVGIEDEYAARKVADRIWG